MRPKKTKTVKLVVPAHGLEKEFTPGHAERLLDMGPALNGGWELPKDSKYTYSEEDGLRLRTAKTGGTETE